jgi:hypothetical protein
MVQFVISRCHPEAAKSLAQRGTSNEGSLQLAGANAAADKLQGSLRRAQGRLFGPQKPMFSDDRPPEAGLRMTDQRHQGRFFKMHHYLDETKVLQGEAKK